MAEEDAEHVQGEHAHEPLVGSGLPRGIYSSSWAKMVGGMLRDGRACKATSIPALDQAGRELLPAAQEVLGERFSHWKNEMSSFLGLSTFKSPGFANQRPVSSHCTQP